MDARITKMADVLVNYSIGVRPEDWTVIQTTPHGIPLAVACVEAILRAGGYPGMNLYSEEIQEAVLRHASDRQLAFVSPTARTIVEHEDCSIGIMAPGNTRAMAGIDPQRLALQAKAASPVQETYMARAASGDLRWTATAYPTQAAAQDAGMSLREYEDFVFGAGLLDAPDPVEAWQRLGERQQRVAEWLEGKDEMRVHGPVTDLTLSVAGRTWLNDDGHKNFPGGEVFTSPVEDSAEGVVQFAYPAAYGGREVTGVRLVFRAGKVVEAHATADQAFLQEMLALDEGSSLLGEFAFGTNPGIPRFTKNVLFDEKMGGTLHMALGHSILEAGGTNISGLHWDMVFDLRTETEVTVDGQVLLKNGVFQI
jgi:aminopeptidase